METRRKKSTDVGDFARRLILSKEYESTLRRRVQEGLISRDFAKTLLGYARTPQPDSPQAPWLEELATLAALQRIADGDREH